MADYYYGADLLFEKHPDLVGELGKECPSLLETLLDGLLWHSNDKRKGTLLASTTPRKVCPTHNLLFLTAVAGHLVRVNYYIK